MSLSEISESLQFRSQAMVFANSSTGKGPFVMKEEVGYNFKKCPALKKKCNTCEKMGHFSKMCRSKTQPKSGKSDQHNNFCEEEGKLSGQTLSEIEMGMYYTRENVVNMSVTWEYITVEDHKVKMQVDTAADSSLISSLFWTELGKPQLKGKVRLL